MKKILFLLPVCIAFYSSNAQCLASSHPTNDCSGGAYIGFVSINNIANYPGGCITSDGYYYNANSPYGLMIGATLSYTILCGTTMGVAMWIDLNNDGVLSANEMLISSSPKATHYGTFTVPKSAIPFASGRIRFRSAWNLQIQGHQACTNDLGGAGDTQDYLISLFCGTLSVPALTVTPANPVVCKGGSRTLIASGAHNYTWTPSNSNAAAISVTPVSSTYYTVSGTSTSCPGSDKKIVFVKVSDPVVQAAAERSVICVGESNTITASGAASYSWSSAQQGEKIIITPTLASTAAYTVTGTDASGCKKSANISFAVEECVGIQQTDASASGKILLFPNPVKHVMTIKSASGGHIEIVNATGQVVRKLHLESGQETFVSELRAGVYFIRSCDGATALNEKFIVAE